jgi:sugar (glycoside-pentoside-hexuronide) transporter
MLTLRTKLGYALGDLANNLMFQLSVLYLLFFYTDVAGISPAAAGILFLAARIWDAVNDPMMGVIIDHTRSRHGKSRVYLRYASLPLAVVTVLLFYAPPLSPGGKILYASVTYILWGMLYTVVSIAYASMTAELTSDREERTSLSSIRMLFMLGGVIVVSVATEPLTGLFATPERGYLVTTVIYAVSAFLLFQACFTATGSAVRQSPEQPKENRYTLREVFPLLIQNKPLIILTAAFLIGATAEYIREASVIYFVTYNMGNGSLLPLFMGVVVLSMVGANLLIPAACRRWDKKGAYFVGASLAVVGSVVFHFIPADNLVAILAAAAFGSFGITVVSTLGWAMLPDTVEYGEWKTGKRTEGIVYSFFSFSQKLATALAGGIAALTLTLTGYVSRSPGQSQAALTGIRSTLTFIPAGCLVISMGILLFYRLDRKSFQQIQGDLG